MHIPDGYLSPATSAAAAVVTIGFIGVAARRVRERVKTRHVPTLAVLSAVCFLVMMFNVPIPDGTTAHAVGGSLIAILLGPWAAVIGVTVALVFQALLFGDGGVLTLGANVLNMAVVLPFAGYGVYRLIAGDAPLRSGRRVLAAGVGGYLGLNAAALMTGIELGIQPDLFHTASGAPLYSPYDLAQAVPAMMFAHLTVAGFAEAVLSAGVLAYLQRANPALLRVNQPELPVAGGTTRRARFFRPWVAAAVAVGIMVILTPLGLLAPGGAFGEDAPADLPLNQLGLSAVPQGLADYSGIWGHALFGDYDFAGSGNATIGYLVSAVVGIVVVGAGVFLIATLLRLVLDRSARPAGAAVAGSGSKIRSGPGSDDGEQAGTGTTGRS